MAELSTASSCCSIFLCCCWNTASELLSSGSGCICQGGQGRAHGDQAQSGPNTHLWATPTLVLFPQSVPWLWWDTHPPNGKTEAPGLPRPQRRTPSSSFETLMGSLKCRIRKGRACQESLRGKLRSLTLAWPPHGPVISEHFLSLAQSPRHSLPPHTHPPSPTSSLPAECPVGRRWPGPGLSPGLPEPSAPRSAPAGAAAPRLAAAPAAGSAGLAGSWPRDQRSQLPPCPSAMGPAISL